MDEDEEKHLLLNMLPEGYEYAIVQHKLEHNNLEEMNFTLEFRTNVRDCDGVKLFLVQFNQSSDCTFNVESGKADRVPIAENKMCIFSGSRKCCMKVVSTGKKELQPGKNTNCTAKVIFKLEHPKAKKPVERKMKSDYPLWVKIDFHHKEIIIIYAHYFVSFGCRLQIPL